MIQIFKIRNMQVVYFVCFLLHFAKTNGIENRTLDVNAHGLSNDTQHLINKNIIKGIQDPDVKSIIKSALGNDSTSEVVLKKNLIVFPSNTPNLVITNKQEVHKIPGMAGKASKLGSNSTFSEVKEVNELSLAELIPLNETIIKTNGTDRQKRVALISDSIPVTPPLSSDLDTANDIVFRPLFRYRQETRLRAKNTYNREYRRFNYGRSKFSSTF
ncbi:uncharacterized protein LOC122505394 [Leptopilina heterotoma]|uniref:uncharacterized protein LOC122505394 n=1 Tax=Leptopilina heterotoma TaxID=63436 RepID=UPI001CA92376|nr:uncharacterized protein LOC122505394 [Leptopilina heterotoma]